MSFTSVDTSTVTRVWTTRGEFAIGPDESVRAVPGFLVIAGPGREILIADAHVVAVERPRPQAAGA